MEVRRLKDVDAALACRVAEVFKSARVDREYMRQFLADEQNYLYAALFDGEPAGFILGYELPRIDSARPMMFLYELEVAARHRRRGVGRALVRELERVCHARGFLKMFVLTNEHNLPAMNLYTTTGGKRINPDDVMFNWTIDQQQTIDDGP